MIKTKIDEILFKFTQQIIYQEDITTDDIMNLLNECRYALEVDAVLVCEALIDEHGFHFPYVSCINELSPLFSEKVQASSNLFEHTRKAFDDDGLSENTGNITSTGVPVRNLYYGFLKNECLDGCVCIMIYNDLNRNWSKEERVAVQRLGRVIKNIIHESRIEKIELIHNKELLETNNQLKIQEALLKEQLEIIEGISREYSSIFIVDWKEKTLKLFKTSYQVPELLNIFSITDDYDKKIYEYIEYAVHPEDRSYVREELQASHIEKILEKQNQYTINFRRVIVGEQDYAQVRYFKIDSKDGSVKILMAIRSVNEIVEKEREQQNHLEVAISEMNFTSELMSAMASDTYSTVYLIDLENGSVSDYCIGQKNCMKSHMLNSNWDKCLSVLIKYVEDVENINELALYTTEYLKKLPPNVTQPPVHFSTILDPFTEKETPNRRWFTAKFIVIQSNEKKYGVLFTVDDTAIISKELSQKELLKDALIRAEAANKSKSTFLSNMSHDIRTPMNAIIGFTAMAQKYIQDTEKTRDCLEKIQSSSSHLLRLINDILDMSRIESGKVFLEEAPCNIHVEFESLRNMVQNEMDERNLRFVLDTSGVRDADIYCDILRSNQVILNLLSNSMKFTKPGGEVRLTINQLQDSTDGYGSYEISVRDNGIGMSKEFQEHAFEAFERAQTSTVSKIQGTGLGLAITKKIVDMANGHIQVISELGKGSEFIININFRLQKQIDSPTVMQVEEIDTELFKDKRILLVEDNELNREIAIEILEEEGFLVEYAEDGSIAVDKVRKNKEGYYDLILMDIQMPYMDGYQATRVIRSLEKKRDIRVPIAAMTANAFDEDRKKAFESGMDEHISKPIDMAKLMEVLKKLL